MSASVSVDGLPGRGLGLDEVPTGTAGSSFMLLSDNGSQLIYRVDVTNGGFAPNAVYAAGQGTLLSVNTTTGVMTPLYVGMNAPHGLIFVND